jgi:hypothetical protein
MEEKRIDDNTVRLYEKPKLRTIELAADEVLAGNCKNKMGLAGPATANHPCIWANCKLCGS